MLDQKTKRDLFGDFQRSLDLIHGRDALSPVGGSYVHRRSAGSSHFVIGEHGRVNGMQRNAAGAEPIRNFTDMLPAVGVVNMLPRREDFDGLRAAANQPVQ